MCYLLFFCLFPLTRNLWKTIWMFPAATKQNTAWFRVMHKSFFCRIVLARNNLLNFAQSIFWTGVLVWFDFAKTFVFISTLIRSGRCDRFFFFLFVNVLSERIQHHKTCYFPRSDVFLRHTKSYTHWLGETKRTDALEITHAHTKRVSKREREREKNETEDVAKWLER